MSSTCGIEMSISRICVDLRIDYRGYNETPTEGHKMSSELHELMEMLKSNPGYAYITPDGTRLIALVGPQQKLMVAACLLKPFNMMSDEEINEFIQNLLK